MWSEIQIRSCNGTNLASIVTTWAVREFLLDDKIRNNT